MFHQHRPDVRGTQALYVHADVYDDVCAALVEVAGQMPMGRGLDENNVLGPLQNRAQFDIVARLVEAAKSPAPRCSPAVTPTPTPPATSTR